MRHTTTKNKKHFAGIIRILELLGIFIGGVILFSNLFFTNRYFAAAASDLADPTLPVMCIDIDGNKVNQMFGYTSDMNAANMRESLIPMTTRREITVSYKDYGSTVRSVAYEVTAPDTGEVVENAKIGDFKADGDYKTATFELNEPILMNREYPICFTLETSAGTVRYYARVIQRSDPVTSTYVQFVEDFYQNCLDPDTSSDINSYLETDNTITNNTFTNVNLKSTLKQLTWGSLSPALYRKSVPTIREINSATCTITNDYILSSAGDADETEYYDVHEYYRLRYYNGRMYVLNFHRDAEQVYDAALSSSVTATGVNLGIASRTVQYASDESGELVAFVQNGALWEFNEGSEKVCLVFSMNKADTDERLDNRCYDIKIIRAYEGGGLDFMVYGYMSRGEHEGSQGIMVCHYNPESQAVTEQVFVPYNKSWQMLKNDLARLSYENLNGDTYLYLDRTVYMIASGTNQGEAVLTDINPDCFVANGNQNMIAWMDEMEENAAKSITVMNLDTGESRNVAAEDGQYVKALGFFNDDFLYGIADPADLVTQPSGTVTFAMKTLRIESFDGTVAREYSQDGIWITGVDMEPGLADLTRVTKDANGNYAETSQDNIMNNKQESDQTVTIATGSSNRQGTTVTLKMPSGVSNIKPESAAAKIQFSETERADLDLPGSDSMNLYYVYTEGQLADITTDPARAVEQADAGVGTVLNQEGQYIYERGNKQTKTELANEDIPEAFLSGEISTAALQASVGDAAAVMNLTGCTLDEVLYQLSEGRAVATVLADGSHTVIVGYDRYNTLLYNFDSGEHYYMGINDSTASMLAGGNNFVTYIEPQETVKAS